MAVNLPDTPDEIGATWTNPETGVDYEWDGERWAVVNLQTDFEDIAYLSQNQKFTGDNIFEGNNKFKLKDPLTNPLIIESSSGSAQILQVKGYVSDSDLNNRQDVFHVDGKGNAVALNDLQAGRRMEAPVYLATDSTISADNQLTTKKFVDEAKDSSYQYTDDKASEALQEAKDYTDASVPDTSKFLLTTGSRAMTGLLNMGSNTIGALADPVYSTDGANRRWVEGQVSASVDNPQMQLQLWQYKGMASSTDEFQNLRAGEFMIRHKSTSGSYDWELAINVKDRDSKYWYPYNKASNYAHTNHIDYVTINDCFGQVRWGGKQESLHFNEWMGVGAYLRIDGRYWKQTFTGNPFTKDWWYIIKLSGLLPHWKYPLSVQQNGQTSFNTEYYGVDDTNEDLVEANGSGEQ